MMFRSHLVPFSRSTPQRTYNNTYPRNPIIHQPPNHACIYVTSHSNQYNYPLPHRPSHQSTRPSCILPNFYSVPVL